MKRNFVFVCLIFLALSVWAAGSGEVSGPSQPLRVGIMPDADSLPFMVAADNGYFDRAGVKVELVNFSNPQERDAALQAGRLDGTIADLLAAAFYAAGGLDFKVTSLTDGRYGIVGSPKLGISGLADLRGKRIALSVNTIIQYTVDAQLSAAGVSMNEYDAVAVPQMPLRIEMVLEGQIEAAGIPEPLLTAATARGALLLSSTDTTGIDAGVLLFSKKVLDSRLSDVKAFYRAYYEAAQAINSSPDSYRGYLVEKAGFPEAVKDVYQFTVYRKPSLPERSQIIQALDWLKSRKLLEADIKPEDLVDSSAIGEW